MFCNVSIYISIYILPHIRNITRMTCRKYDMPNYEKAIQSKDSNVSNNPTGQRIDIPNIH